MKKRIERLERVVSTKRQAVKIYWGDGTFVGSYEMNIRSAKSEKVDK